MTFLDGLERLINERGSAAILRERIALLNEQHAAVEKKSIVLEQQVTRLLLLNERHKLERQQLQVQIDNFKTQLIHNPNPHNYICEHCGSPRLIRAGTRTSPGPLGRVGLKDAIYRCDTCGKDSFIELPMPG